MSYVVPIHRPSGVRHAVKLNFLNASNDALVIALVTLPTGSVFFADVRQKGQPN